MVVNVACIQLYRSHHLPLSSFHPHLHPFTCEQQWEGKLGGGVRRNGGKEGEEVGEESAEKEGLYIWSVPLS